MPDHISPIEALWDLIALAGIIFSIRVIIRYRKSHRGAVKIPDSEDRQVAVDLIRDYTAGEVNRLVQHCISLALGIAASYIRPMVQSAQSTRAQIIYGILVIVGFILINMLTTLNSLRAYRAWLTRYGLVAIGRRLHHDEHGNPIQ